MGEMTLRITKMLYFLYCLRQSFELTTYGRSQHSMNIFFSLYMCSMMTFNVFCGKPFKRGWFLINAFNLLCPWLAHKSNIFG